MVDGTSAAISDEQTCADVPMEAVEKTVTTNPRQQEQQQQQQIRDTSNVTQSTATATAAAASTSTAAPNTNETPEERKRRLARERQRRRRKRLRASSESQKVPSDETDKKKPMVGIENVSTIDNSTAFSDPTVSDPQFEPRQPMP
ncbi:MAG: hypothetical protein AAGJ35_14970, partial [Myxococcota bacterium]